MAQMRSQLLNSGFFHFSHLINVALTLKARDVGRLEIQHSKLANDAHRHPVRIKAMHQNVTLRDSTLP